MLTAQALAPGLRQTFDREGYVALRGFLSPDEVREVRANIDRYVRDLAPGLPGNMVFYEDKDRPETIKGLQHMYAHDAFFADLFASPRIVALAETLLGERVTGKNMQWFNKPPGASTPTPPHQDGYYFMLKPQSALTMWLGLDEVDEANGAIRYIPASHLGPMRPHGRTGVLGFSQGITDYGPGDHAAEQLVPAQPGDMLAHHAMTIHRADANTTPRTRKALGFIFYSESAVEDRAGHEAYYKSLFRELETERRI